MDKEKTDKMHTKSSCPVPTGLPINWGLITGPIPEPVFPASSLNTSLLPPPPPPPQSSAVHSLQTKVKSLTQRRTRGREREKDRERVEAEVQVSGPSGQTSSDLFLRQRPRGKGQLSVPSNSWRSGAAKDLSSSDEEEEVEVQVRLEIHSPPVEVRTKQVGEENEEKTTEQNGGQVRPLTEKPCGLGLGTSLESLLSDNSSSGKDEPSPPTPPPELSSSPVPTSAPITSSSSLRHWAPPKGFWRVARPETLLLNGVGPHNIPPTLPLKDYTRIEVRAEPQKKCKPSEPGNRNEVEGVVDDTAASSQVKHSDSAEFYLDRREQREEDAVDSGEGPCSSDICESTSPQSGVLGAELKLKVKERAYAKLRERQQNCKEKEDQPGGESVDLEEDLTYRVDYKVSGDQDSLDSSDTKLLAQELEPYLRSLLVISDELPLSPRHEEAKRLLERARLKARSNHFKGDRPRRSHSDQRSTVKKQEVESPSMTAVQKDDETKEEPPAQTVSGPLLVPAKRDTSPSDQASRPRRYGCSPTRVRFEDESEKDAESRYLDRVRQRGRPGMPKSKAKEGNTDPSSSGSERSRGHRSVSTPPSQKQDELIISNEATTVVKEIIVLVKKCEACGSVVREPQPVSSPSDPQNNEPQQSANSEESRGKTSPCRVPSNKPEPSTRPKAPLTVTFAGAYVLGEDKESSSGWKASGFGKLRRRSRKGESRMESGHGPYGPSWAQRRNSNPRNRVNLSRAVSFAPGSPVALEPQLLEASGGLRESSTPPLPIKSALKSSSRNRSAAGQSTVQFVPSSQGGEGGSQSLLDSSETRRESPVSFSQGATMSSPVPCIRPSSLRYPPVRVTTELPSAELWDATPDGAGLSGETGPGSEFRGLRSLAMSRPEDLRAELLRAEHLKAEALWEENPDGSRKLDGRPKLFLRRFFSSIGLNSVGRLVKGGRSSSMEQLSLPTVPRASSASPSPTRRPQPTIRIQRTPSLQTLHTVLPLAQLRKASSVQSLERRTERSTILGEVQIPYGLAPSPESPQFELHRTLSVEDVVVSRMVRPVGRVTQALPDGTVLLELIKPPNGPFGFVISRGKGRPHTGVYVEKVGDGSVEGLLGVGDEILQVNGEAMAGLSLDQVTRLMTRESMATLRILPARRNQR
ncbi:uncharacterized protein si:ch211-13f8.1 [Kryptolebias marmoratus]|uniref:Si:ch211-13f8.1 n=1 Tax=Kryptolebias marmoratus TaxID=37003 RepID=A0A3Q3AB55_KRYMA|nr:uncharacterized protein si:ch211-13f8.1 [Kryptolebias marmoratus]